MRSPASLAPAAGAATVDDSRWARIQARDASADGQFWYSVATTGVYCRPSCASRTANPRNVRLHDTLAQARATGCRPCRRCRPDGPGAAQEAAARVTRACRLIETSAEPPSLAALAARLKLSPAHFHRLFKATTGVTPRAYASAQRAARVRERLGAAGADKGAGTVTAAFLDAGFNSSGRFYAQSHEILGMTPSHYRAGGAHEELRFAVGDTSLGAILVAASPRGIAALLLGDEPAALVRELQDRFPRARLVGADRDFAALVARVVGHVETPGLRLELPLDIRGTAFQQRVWQALREIPPGETRSYAEVAAGLGMPNAVRAVAGACAANRVGVLIPCHRVVKSDGRLSGYAWGVERKKALLAREKAAP